MAISTTTFPPALGWAWFSAAPPGDSFGGTPWKKETVMARASEWELCLLQVCGHAVSETWQEE